MTFSELRDSAHKSINDRPDDVDLISHNYSLALIQLDVPPTIFQACVEELFRRWEYSLSNRIQKKIKSEE